MRELHVDELKVVAGAGGYHKPHHDDKDKHDKAKFDKEDKDHKDKDKDKYC